MNKRSKLSAWLLFFVFITVVLSPSSAISQTTAKQEKDPSTTVKAKKDTPIPAKKKKAEKNDDPVEITAERMRSEGGGQKVIFSGNVISYWGDVKITSDILEIYNSEDKTETDEIVAIGNVFVTRGDRRARGDRAVYLDKLQKIILTGSPKATAWEGDDMVEGREMIFLLETDRFVVNERVRMMLYPKDDEDDKEKGKKKGKEKKTGKEKEKSETKKTGKKNLG